MAALLVCFLGLAGLATGAGDGGSGELEGRKVEMHASLRTW